MPILPKTIFRSKKFCVQKILKLKKGFKNILGLRKFWFKRISSKNLGQQKLGAKSKNWTRNSRDISDRYNCPRDKYDVDKC